jgi:hypothetical protein
MGTPERAAAASTDTEKRMSYEEVHAYVREHFCPDMDDHPEAKAWAEYFWEHLASRSRDD